MLFGMHRILAATFVLAMLSAMMACPAPKPVAPVGDASDASSTESSCSKACENMRVHHCSAGFGVDGGDSCETVCNRTQADHTFDMKPDCLSLCTSTDCFVHTCGTVSCQ